MVNSRFTTNETFALTLADVNSTSYRSRAALIKKEVSVSRELWQIGGTEDLLNNTGIEHCVFDQISRSLTIVCLPLQLEPFFQEDYSSDFICLTPKSFR